MNEMTTSLTAAPAASPGLAESLRTGWLPLAVFAWILIWTVLVVVNLPSIAALEFRDPDDELRLQQVRDLIAGQGWFDLHQYRIDAAGGGVLMHWSRLVDAPIAAVILLLRPLLGQALAEQIALVAIPAVTLFAMIAVVAWMATRTLEQGPRICAVLALGFAVPAMIQVLPMRIDHHGWQIVLALIAVAAFLDRDERRGGTMSGAALAAWMAISFEGLPFSALFIAVLSVWSLIDLTMRERLVATMQALAAVSAGLFLLTRGVADLAQHCDAIAPVHLAMFGWGALAITLPAALVPRSRVALLAGLGSAAGGAVALIGLAAPQCTTGSFDMLDPVVRDFWYDNVQEGKPLFQADWYLMVQYLVPPLIGLHAAIALARASNGPMRRWWIFYALMLAGALAIGCMVLRAASIAGALAALPLGWRIAFWIAALKRPSNPFLRLGELMSVALLIFSALLPSMPAMAVGSVFDNRIAERAAEKMSSACQARKAGGILDALPRGDILAPLDFGPNVLASSNKGVLATAHHRGAPAMRAVIDAFTGTPEQAREVMRGKNLRYLMICPSIQEMDHYRKHAPNGMAAQLLDGQVPAWLRPVPLPAASGLRMWERVD